MAREGNVAEPVIVKRTFNVPVGRVWQALTNADQMKHWYLPCWRSSRDLQEFKPEGGFEFEFVVEPDGNTYHHLCKVTEVIPQKKIAYTWRYKGEPGSSLVTFELFDEGERTRLRVTHSDIETFPRKPGIARENFEEGWTQLIGSDLKRFLENKQDN